MTGSIGAAWYPDPDGTPGRLRWWNGEAWSDVTTAAGPGIAVLETPEAPARPPDAPPSRRRTGWAVGTAALALLVAVLVTLLVAGPGGERVEDPPPRPDPVAGSAFPPGTVRIVDDVAGLSYPYLGNGWYEYDLSPEVERTAVAGQYFTTEQLDAVHIYIAECTSGPLAERFGYSGPAGLPATTAEVADFVRGYFPQPHHVEVRRDEPRTVDGHPAHLLEWDLSWEQSPWTATGERTALLLVDTGRPAPALLVVSIPNTHAELYGVIERVLADVRVI
jgi:hypothetical protein